MLTFFWWGWAMGTFGVAASGVANAMLFWAYDRNYECSMDSSDSNQSSCAAFGPTLELELIQWSLYETTVWYTIGMYTKSWIAV